ncbi:uncharacterized protein BDW70DRAFT_137755 [Aspergillus foveolatus]|uniref:uncharacterized protein n=1 Tax=Aspergillus foveolatus TaxID=210207 RepID=UPI003CCCE8A7
MSIRSQSMTAVSLSSCSRVIWNRCMVPVLTVAGLISFDIFRVDLLFPSHLTGCCR